MTVIAWDGKTLAADKRGTMGGHVITLTKIQRIADYLVGFSGVAERSGVYRTWLESGRDAATYPKQDEKCSVDMLVISRNGRVEFFQDTPSPVVIEDAHVAIGSGRDYARAAMHLGRTASEAVAVASLFDEGCGNGADALTFDDAGE